MSSRDEVVFGVTGDWDTASAVAVLAGGIRAGLAELVGCASAAQPTER